MAERIYDHDELLVELCINLRNCGGCGGSCCPMSELECYAGLKVVDEKHLYLETYNEQTNARLISIAESFGYKAGVIKDGDDLYIEFVKQ